MVLVESKPRIQRVHAAHRIDLRKSEESVLRDAAFVLEMTRRVKESILTDSPLPFESDEARRA